MSENKPKIAVVTCAYIPKGKVEYNTRIRSVVDINHYQSYDEDKYETLKFTLACHKYYGSGMDYDLFVIDNSSPDESINEIENYCIENNINFHKRENVGFSFGAFKWAFYKYWPYYDYFLFHEQDFAPAKDGWLKEMVNFFNSEENIGAVGNCVEGPRGPLNIEAEGTYRLYPELNALGKFINLDQMALMKTDILKAAIDKFGWRLVEWTPELENSSPATINELSFTIPIYLSGHKIKGFLGQKTHICTHGICVMDEQPWEEELPDSQVAPMVLVHARVFHPRFKKLFNWYNK